MANFMKAVGGMGSAMRRKRERSGHRRQHADALESIETREAELEMRLNYLDAQLRRIGRLSRRWDPHMTVVEADIRELGYHSPWLMRILGALKSPLVFTVVLGGVVGVGAALVLLR